MRVARLAILGLAGIALAVMAVRIGWSRTLVDKGQAGAALAVWGGNADAAARRAEQLFDAGKYREAQTLAVRALSQSAHNSLALRVYAMAAGRLGDPQGADAAMVFAAQLGWRDGFVQRWIFDQAMASGDMVAASRAADAMMRIDFQRNEILQRIKDLVATPQGRDALAERLSDRPYWGPAFLARFKQLPPDQAANFIELLVAMDARGVRPDDEQIRPFFNAMLARGDLSQALALWHRFNRTVTGDPTTGVVDGNFIELSKDTGPGDRSAGARQHSKT
jgi:hypothetical protein